MRAFLSLTVANPIAGVLLGLVVFTALPESARWINGGAFAQAVPPASNSTAGVSTSIPTSGVPLDICPHGTVVCIAPQGGAKIENFHLDQVHVCSPARVLGLGGDGNIKDFEMTNITDECRPPKSD
jgi:hypothetical protein